MTARQAVATERKTIMKSSSDLQDALQVVAESDQATYVAMQAADWLVTSDVDEALDGVPDGMQQMLATMALTNRPAGMTFRQHGYSGQPRTIIDTDLVQFAAGYYGVPPAMYMAVTLAHEFRHISQPVNDTADGEREAFAAGVALARKLPAPWGDKLARLHAADEQPELDKLQAQGALVA